MIYAQPMARSVLAPAAFELLERSADGREHATTVSFGGDDFTLYGHVRARRTAPGRAEVGVTCWLVNIDLARFVGGNPPTDDETRLPPEGTARPDGAFTIEAARHLAIFLDALDGPRASTNGDGHRTMTVPVPDPAPVTASADDSVTDPGQPPSESR
ncbi:hypothetical protein ACIO93_20780 [Streptomyces sp. NPDC087903]|uniref:hypothetical protein n=1 Tax=Streptomyces sp. NPDC087903 TaxID=3365819 RepID=UPI0037F6C58F